MGIEQDTSERAPAAAEVHRRALKAERLDLRCCTVARVVRFDAATRKVDVQPLIKDSYTDEGDERAVESFPVVANCPVQFFGVGGFVMTGPISDGNLIISGARVPATIGTLFFSDRSLDAWLAGSGDEVDPGIDHDHALTDGIFMPGLLPFGAPDPGWPTDHMTIGSASGPRLHMHGDVIAAGDEAGNDFVALAQKVSDQLSTLKTAISGTTIVAQDGGASFKSTLISALSTWPGSMAATQFKAK